MDRRKITAELSSFFEKYIDPNNDPRIYWAKEVTFDYSTDHKIRVDYMRFKPLNNSVSGIEKGDFYCYEIKSSVDDFLSKNGHNFVGDFNYYVMPREIFDDVKSKIPYHVGVLVPNKHLGLLSVKNTHRVSRSRPVSEMLLMMWRSSRRELINGRNENHAGLRL